MVTELRQQSMIPYALEEALRMVPRSSFLPQNRVSVSVEWVRDHVLQGIPGSDKVQIASSHVLADAIDVLVHGPTVLLVCRCLWH